MGGALPSRKRIINVEITGPACCIQEQNKALVN